MTSRSTHSGLHWRIIGAVFYRENVQRLPLPLVCKEHRLQTECFWLQYVRLPTAYFKISFCWLASRNNDQAITPFSIHYSIILHRPLYSKSGDHWKTIYGVFLYVQWVYCLLSMQQIVRCAKLALFPRSPSPFLTFSCAQNDFCSILTDEIWYTLSTTVLECVHGFVGLV